MDKLEVGVVGLGKFGFSLATALMDLGHTVVGMDTDEGHVRIAQDAVSQAWQANGTDKQALKQLRYQDLDLVVVSVGGSMEASILIVLNLQELGVERLVVKAVSPEHCKVLERLGVSMVIQPERDAAQLLANRITNPGMLDLLPLGGDVLLQELVVDKWAGRTLMELQLTRKGVMVVAVRPSGGGDYHFVPAADVKLEKNATLAVIGKRLDVTGLKS